MTRISEIQAQRQLVAKTVENKRRVGKFANQVASGVKAALPSDTVDGGTIARYKQTLDKIDSYTTTIQRTKSLMTFQDDVLSQANDLLVRAKEIAQQGANESVNAVARTHLAEEVYQIRDHMVSLANSTYQGRFVFGGTDDDDPPYDETTFTTPASGEASRRFVFDGELGTATARTLAVTDDLTISITTPADEVFGTAIEALQRLGRALGGFTTTPASGAPDGGGAAYSFPADYKTQSADILNSINLLNQARDTDILPERVSVGGRLRRLETGESLLALTKNSALEVLSRIQDADET
jgi:flagellar hook-associated protein 3 FlgL